MNQQTINFTVSEQELINTTGELIFASDTVSYIKAVFSLGTNWSGYDSVRAVWKNGKITISTVLDANNSCNVPIEVLTLEGKVRVNLIGSIVDNDEVTDRLTSFSVIALNVVQKISLEGSETQPITPSQFEQYVEAVESIVDGADQYALISEGYALGKQNGTDVDSSSPYYHNNSKYYSEQASDSATAAAGSAASAESAAEAVVESLGLSVVDGALCQTYID